MKAPFTPAKLSAAIVTLSLMSAPLYTAAQATDDDTAQAAERVEQAAENRPAIEERSYDTQQAAEELTDDTEQAAAEAEQETEQAAAEAEQETEQAAAQAEQETEQAAAEMEQETEQAAAEAEQETEQAAAEIEQETEETAAEAEQNTEQAAAEAEQETEQAAAEAEQETEQAAAEIDNEEGIVEGETLVDEEETEVAAAGNAESQDEELSGAMEDVKESVEVVQTMQQEADMQQLLDRAKGVFVVPDYAVAALIIGGSGGEGVLLKKEEGGNWTNPVFYDIGSMSAGLQAGAAAGSIAMVLLSDNALDAFREDTNFGFTADAGYSIINWSERARAEIGLGTDAVVWTDTEGLFGELAVGVTGISPDEEEIAEYYNTEAQPQEILAGNVENPHEQMLQQALSEQ